MFKFDVYFRNVEVINYFKSVYKHGVIHATV